MGAADSPGAPEARFAEQGSAQAPARDRRLYARDQMGAAILPRPREAGLGQIPVRQRQPLRFPAPRPVARRQDEGMAAILPPGALPARRRPVTTPFRPPPPATHPARMAQHQTPGTKERAYGKRCVIKLIFRLYACTKKQ